MSDKTPDPYFDLIMDEDLANNEWPRGLDEIKEKGTRCIAISSISKEDFEANKHIKTKSGGWTLARAINTGVVNPTSFLGCHAGDLESYQVFGEILFDKVIAKYHGGYDVKTGNHVTDMDSSKITEDLSPEAKKKIISTRIRVARNISTFPLNPGGTKETRLAIADLMEKVFAGLEGDLAGTFYRHTTMTPEQQQQLIDDHFLFRGKDKMQAASGYHEHWPHGRGIFVSNTKEFLLWINEGDHLRIISMEKGGDVKRVFDRLSRGIAAIEAGLKKELGIDDVFMHTPSHGCITCCPTNLGTAMRGSVHILVPKLIKSMGFEAIDKFARERNCQARGSTGEHSEVIDRIDISNWRRLGYSEWSLVQDMIKCVNELSKMEDEAPEGSDAEKEKEKEEEKEEEKEKSDQNANTNDAKNGEAKAKSCSVI
ncbi:arginine kinase-like [Actinia tenebrosa]|uniref:Arginine kinase-like n=1 Tax=Actinia tenebrosa TaxID=6105 RepID=A0A6P8J6I9_ACTTE|nr:arginine kinase-like [Actinia tenebrosa]